MVKDIKIECFDYLLPDERIPRHPLAQRDACRLLVTHGDGSVSHETFSSLPSLLPPESLLICNDTKVINARIAFRKPTGSRIEVFLLEPIDPADYVVTFQTRGECVWKCMVGNLKRWKEGELAMEIHPEGFDHPFTLKAERLRAEGGNAHAVRFTWDNPEATFATVVETAGNIPIPPYLKRESEQSDSSDYQTVYADAKGSVAAPTAGLHFTPALFDALRRAGIAIGKLTLHVGAGTFQPVKSDTIGDHPMHTETFTVTLKLLEQLAAQKGSGRPVAAVGTTSVRTLESLPVLGALIRLGRRDLHVGQWDAYDPTVTAIPTEECLESLITFMKEEGTESLTASTAIMIAPGFNWRMTDIMVTNFHQPQSTLLLLVSSFTGGEDYQSESPKWRELYDEALASGYRFLSYGDACLLFRPQAVKLPLSKSLGARMLTAAYYSGTLSQIPQWNDCEDIAVIRKALAALSEEPGESAGTCAPIDLKDSGTALRFVAAAAASIPEAVVTLIGSPRLMSRPMSPLLDVLDGAGAITESLGGNGCGPYRIAGGHLLGGDYNINGEVSSQFISALMLAAPTWKGGLRLHFTTPPVSHPYIEMTASVMHSHGIGVKLGDDFVEVAEGTYRPVALPPEADWSAAAFFYEAVLLGGKDVKLAGLLPPGASLQGDAAVAGIFAQLGVETTFTGGMATLTVKGEKPARFETDLRDTPDLVPPLAVGCALAGIHFRLTGIGHLRDKECDRISVLAAGLRKFGIAAEEGDDTLAWNGGRCPAEATPTIDSCGDHRMAMAFAMAACADVKVIISNPACVAKSFGDFWSQLQKTGLKYAFEGNTAIVERGGKS